MTGFSKNPVNPFQTSTVTTNRILPLHEFNNGRLYTDTLNGTLPTPGFPGYLDTLKVFSDAGVIPFYAYFSAYGGAGYDPDDCNQTEPDPSTLVVFQGAFPSTNAVTPTAAKNGTAGIVQSPAPNPYTSSAPVPTNSSGDAVAATGAKPRA